jgi:hypothetical protein
VDTTAYFEQRFKSLMDAIFSTGDGKTMQTAIKIVDVEDDYVVKGVMGFLGGEETHESDSLHSYSVWIKEGHKLYLEDL